MARIRTIKPEFWTDSRIVQLPYEARLLFVGLWNFADDEGYLTYDSDQLKLQIMPADDVDCRLLLDVLVAAELLEVYSCDTGCDLILIRHFTEHQKISHPTKSKLSLESSGKKQSIPANTRRALAAKYGCEPGETINCQCYYCGALGKIWWVRNSKGQPGSWVSFSLSIDHFTAESEGGATQADNFVLACVECNKSKGVKAPMDYIIQKFPENSGVLLPEGKGREGNGKEKNTSTRKRVVSYPEDFETWWAAYPKKVGKVEAAKAYRVALKMVTAEVLQAAVAIFKTTPKAQGEFCWNPATWLNQGHWEDDPKEWQERHGNGQPSDDEYQRERERRLQKTRDLLAQCKREDTP